MRGDVCGQPLADRILEPHRGSRAPTHNYIVVACSGSINHKCHGAAANLITSALDWTCADHTLRKLRPSSARMAQRSYIL